MVQVRVSDGDLAERTDDHRQCHRCERETQPEPQSEPESHPRRGPTTNPGNALFDTPFYLSHNPDVDQAGINALDHFNTFGFHEGRDPNSFFDTSGYLAVNKDVAAAGVNPLDHFHQFGWKEGAIRPPTSTPRST